MSSEPLSKRSMVDRLMELRMAADRVEEALIDLRAAVRLFDQPINPPQNPE